MCVKKRFLNTFCNHSTWSTAPVRICQKQLDFMNGRSPEPCNAATSHPLATIKAAKECEKCHSRKEKTDDRLVRAKQLIASSKKALIESDESCRAILERAGIDVVEVRPAQESGELDSPANFLRKRKEAGDASLYMV